MFYVNDKHINDPANAHCKKEYERWCKEVWPSLPSKLVLKMNKGHIMNREGVPEIIQKHWIKLKATFTGESSTDTWVYTESLPKTVAGNLVYNNPRIGIGKSITLDKKNKEKVFFFLTKLDIYLNGSLFLENKEQEALKGVELEAREAEVSFLINNKKSPIVNEPKVFKLIAMAWGVSGIDDLSIPEIQKDLFAKVKFAEQKTKDGFTRFLADVENYETDNLIQVRAVIQKALDKNLLTFDGRGMLVNLNTPEGNIPLMPVVNIQSWPKDLADYLNLDPKKLSMVGRLAGEEEIRKVVKPKQLA